MRELRAKVEIWVPLPDDAIERAQRTLQINDEIDRLRTLVADGLVSSEIKEVFARPSTSVRATMRRIDAAAGLDSDEERASDHPIMGDRPAIVAASPEGTTIATAGGDLLAIPSAFDRRGQKRDQSAEE